MKQHVARSSAAQAWGKIEGIDTSELKPGFGRKLVGVRRAYDAKGWRLELQFEGLEHSLPVYIVTKLPLDDWCCRLRKINLTLPALWTTADLVYEHGDEPKMAVHMARALRRTGFESVPPGNKKVRGLIDRRSGKEVQSYVWRLNNGKLPPLLRTVAGVREQYNDQPRRLQSLAEIHRIWRIRQHVQRKLSKHV